MSPRNCLIAVALLCGLVAMSGPGRAAPPTAVVTTKPKLLVPAYFYPDGPGLAYWKQLMATASTASTIAIANPDSGPGKQIDPAYTSVIQQAQAAKIKVIGYVSTSYAKRTAADIKADVDKWVQFYPTVQGIFFDEQVSSADKVAFYLDLKTYTLSKIPQAFVVTNPGVQCAEEYFSNNVADTICVIESSASLHKYVVPKWAAKYPADKFYGLAYGIHTPAEMQACLKAAAQKRMGYVFVTNDVLNNPWDTLPHYWQAEVDAVK
jgi:hypothetical protein